MTMTAMCNKIAQFMQQTDAWNNGRTIYRASDFNDYDRECIATYDECLFSLFYGSNGRKWSEVLKDIRLVAPQGFHLGFKAQDEVISICKNYGIEFT